MNINKSTIEVYYIRNIKYGGWADISIDEGDKAGRISISSSHGNWSYYWGACGSSFKSFLIGLNIHYVAGKFGVGNMLDLNNTIKKWKEDVLFYRHQEDLTSETARELWDEILFIESESPDMEGLKYLLWNKEGILRFYEGIPHIETQIDPLFLFFWDNIWQVFISELRKELSTNQLLRS